MVSAGGGGGGGLPLPGSPSDPPPQPASATLNIAMAAARRMATAHRAASASPREAIDLMHDSGRGVTSNCLHLFRIAFNAPAEFAQQVRRSMPFAASRSWRGCLFTRAARTVPGGCERLYPVPGALMAWTTLEVVRPHSLDISHLEGVVARAFDCAATTGYDLRSGHCRGERS